MKALGTALLILGAFVGAIAGFWVLIGLDHAPWPWLVSIGLVKLTMVASFGIMGAGAALIRLAKRKAQSGAIAR